jgi:hypothetical protein
MGKRSGRFNYLLSWPERCEEAKLKVHQQTHFRCLSGGLVGSFHKVSIKHLNRYLSEFEYKFNNREADDLFSQMLRQMTKTEHLEFNELIKSES